MKYLMLIACIFMVGCGRPALYQFQNAKELFPNAKVGEVYVAGEWCMIVVCENGDVYFLDSFISHGNNIEHYERVNFNE